MRSEDRRAGGLSDTRTTLNVHLGLKQAKGGTAGVERLSVAQQHGNRSVLVRTLSSKVQQFTCETTDRSLL